ncbi:MAG: 2-dehydropantoate 2-reductase [Candidatus Hydrogenedentes bacterium]|nr:2-dehydropantoate 2-reductase [Candidatus Hydrogenedentota bacterium]MBI3117795.1 2-dehydropantoate 2-reductase [Candidatus Hydrogenedentota bacterium]
MRFLIMGAGAIGTVVGGFLARAGHQVALVGREEHMRAIRTGGLRISGIWGEHQVGTLEAATVPGTFADRTFDVIIITVKSYDTRAAVNAIRNFVKPETLVCAYQNGLGNADVLAEAVGWERTVGVRAIYGVRLPVPGAAEVTVIANPTALGAFVPGPHVDRVRALAQMMHDAGLPTVYEDNIAAVIWGKVAYNCALNPLSALLDVPYGRLAEMEETRAIMNAVIDELYRVGASLGVNLSPATAQDYQALFYDKLVPPTAVHYASMREDLRHGRRTEIDALNGAIVRYGAAHGVTCPTNLLLTRLVHARERICLNQ